MGFSVAATRQNAGSGRGASAAVSCPGGVNGPASSACASVIVALGRDSVESDAQEEPACRVRPGTTAARKSAQMPAVKNLMAAPMDRVYDGQGDLAASGNAGIT